MRRISDSVARRMAIACQHLAGNRLAIDAAGILSLLRRLGCLQLDPINVVARSPLLVLWSRLGNYALADFEALLWEDKSLFEYWAHAASIVLTEDFPLYQLRMLGFAGGEKRREKRIRAWLEANGPLRQSILQQLSECGPLLTEEIETVPDVVHWRSSGWSDSRDVNVMLTFLWQRGEIMVTRRLGNYFGLKKQWALTEHHLPQWSNCEPWPEREVVNVAAQKSLRALGLGTAEHIKNHFIRDRYPGLKQVLAGLVNDGRIVPIEVLKGRQPLPGTWYVHTEDLPLLDQLGVGAWQPRTTLLSPFDNLICDRARTEMLFGFTYRTEIYTPKAKRQFGYYVMPVLHGDRLIGRIDPQFNRKTKQLVVNSVHLESGVAPTAALNASIDEAITSLAAYLGADEILHS